MPLGQPFGRHRVQVTLPQQDIVLAAHFHLGLLGRVVQDPVALGDLRTFAPTAITLAQANRLPIATVAGITIPPPERRSPLSPSVDTSTRSCSIRIGSESSPTASLTPNPSCRRRRWRAAPAPG